MQVEYTLLENNDGYVTYLCFTGGDEEADSGFLFQRNAGGYFHFTEEEFANLMINALEASPETKLLFDKQYKEKNND